MDEGIKKWLNDLPSKKRELALKVREIPLKSDSSMSEAVKWGNITFISNGNLAWIFNYPQKDYINFGFFRATELPDPKKLLEGSGKNLRHVKIHSDKDIDEKQFAAWVKEAIKLNKQQLAKKKSLPKK